MRLHPPELHPPLLWQPFGLLPVELLQPVQPMGRIDDFRISNFGGREAGEAGVSSRACLNSLD
jgi:hypothetical protein